MISQLGEQAYSFGLFHPDMPPARNTPRERALAQAYLKRRGQEELADVLGLDADAD